MAGHLDLNPEFLTEKSTQSGNGWAVGDVTIRGGVAYRIFGIEGMFHLCDCSPVFTSKGNVTGLSRGTGMKGCLIMSFDCWEHDPPCVLHIRYEPVLVLVGSPH